MLHIMSRFMEMEIVHLLYGKSLLPPERCDIDVEELGEVSLYLTASLAYAMIILTE